MFCMFNKKALSLNIFCYSVPRVLFDGWTFNDFHIIFSSETAMQGLMDTIVSFLKVSR